eukprot:403362161
MSKVNKDLNEFRYKYRPYEDKHNYNTIEQYKSHREKNLNRSEHQIHCRFPSLQPINNQESQQSNDNFTISTMDNATSKKELQSIIQVPKNKESSFKSYTFSQTLKLRNILHPQNELEKSLSKAFIPVNPHEAKGSISRTIVYEPQNAKDHLTLLQTLDNKEETQKSLSSLQHQSFKRSSPSPQHIGQVKVTLNNGNKFNTFLKNEVEQPRLNVLANFKEISRIMTNNFLKYKQIEQKYKKQQIPNEDLAQKQIDDQTTQKMTFIMKQMNSPRNFTFQQQKRGFSQSQSISRVMMKSPSPNNDFGSNYGSKVHIQHPIRITNQSKPQNLNKTMNNDEVKLPNIKMRFTDGNGEINRDLNQTVI